MSADQYPTDDVQGSEDVEEAPAFLYHEDPATESGLRKLQDKAAFYRFAHAILTGKFDQTFSEWLVKQPVKNDATENLPDLTDLQEWMFADASVQDLILFRRRLNDLLTVLLSELFGRYSGKNVRGQIPADTNLSELRKDLVDTLKAHEQLIKGGMFDHMTVPMIEALPAMLDNEDKKARRADGNWNFPNAPSDDEGGEVKVSRAEGTNNFRAHNTTVKFVVDGVLQEHPTLGIGIGAIFGKDKSTKDVGKLFDEWHSDYCGEGGELPKKIYARDGRKIYWTIVGEK